MLPVVKLIKMASGEEDEVQLQETGTRRTTRATRSVATRRSRGRKKAAASPRTTRSKRNTRTAQSAESDEDEEAQEETQNTSDTEPPQDQTDDQASPEAEKEEEEQTQPVVNKSTEDSSTLENGITEENHDSDERETVETNLEKMDVPCEENKSDDVMEVNIEPDAEEEEKNKRTEENQRDEVKDSEKDDEKEVKIETDQEQEIVKAKQEMVKAEYEIAEAEQEIVNPEHEIAKVEQEIVKAEQEIVKAEQEIVMAEEEDVQKEVKNEHSENDKDTVNGKIEEKIEPDEVKLKKDLEEVESVNQVSNDKEVPELEDSPPPTINNVLPSPIRSGLKIKMESTMPTNIEDSQGESKEVSEEKDINQYTVLEETNPSPASGNEALVSGDEEVSKKEEIVSVEKNEKEEAMEVEECVQESEVAQVEQVESHPQEEENADINPENVEEMTVIDEVTEEGGQEERNENTSDHTAAADSGEMEGGFRTEPDTEMVSEDELPTESSKEPLETEAVSDEELPDPAAAVDLPETEAVSEDELPPEKTDKKKKKTTKQSDGSRKKKSRSEAQKRKLVDGDTYDPSSPTSENSCDESPAAKRAAVTSASGGTQAKPVTKTRKSLPELEKYWKAVKEDPSDFTGWTYLLQYVDQENDIDAAREAYDAFLSHYPYCYGYWRKYADYEKRKGNKEKCEEVFERGLKAIPLSVDLWIHFLNYSKATYPDNEEHLRTQFEKAISACGMEFRSDRLWESYIKWETEGKRLQNVTDLYDRLLAMPTQGYTNHFDSFQEHISSNPPQKVLSVDEFLTLRREVLQLLKQYDQPATVADDTAPGEEVEAPPGEEPEEQPVVKTDEETTALRERIIFIRRKVHKATVSAVVDRWNFEEGIKRPYFHVKPLERCQLKNWKEYLDFEIEQGDQERIVILFERCLIACALYEEFWIKFIRYLESLKGDSTDKIRNVYERACTIHHTKKPNLHLHWAVFEESHKNYDRASEILTNLEKLIPNLLQVAYRRINLERRCNNMDKVCALYEHYISNTKNKVISNNMAIKYARFCWKVKGDVEKAISILNKAVEKDKDNPRLYLQLIDMGLQQNPLNEDNIISIIDQFLNRDTDPEQKVLFAQRKVEFLEDFGSDILSVQKAHDEFQRFFKQAKDRKKKSPDLDGKSLDGSSKKGKSVSDSMQMHSSHTQSHSSPQTTHGSTSQQPPQPPSSSQAATATTSAGQYPPPNYSQTGGYSQQPPTQGGYQGGQYPPTGPQQPPTPYSQPPYNQQYGQSSDPNYANYQNWGYSQTGYGGYNQGWGNYNYY